MTLPGIGEITEARVRAHWQELLRLSSAAIAELERIIAAEA